MGASNLCLLVMFWSWVLVIGFCECQVQEQYSSFTVSSFSHPETKLGPYGWTYMRVELPPWFSSLIMTFLSDIDIDTVSMKRLPKGRLPMICFKDGSPPLPDVSDTHLKDLSLNFLFNGSFGGIQNLRSVEQCTPFQKNLTLTLTNEQISPGTWYIGYFNGLGPARTQSKMISRGQSYMFSTSINIEGCITSTIWGPYCNQTIDLLSCSQSAVYKHSRSLLDVKIYDGRDSLNTMMRSGGNSNEGKQVPSQSSMPIQSENFITCNNSIEASCLGDGVLKFYVLDIMGMASQFMIMANEIRVNQSSSKNNSADIDGILLMCYARYNAMPLMTLHDHSADISRAPLVIQSPDIGRWYIAVHAVNQTTVNGVMKETYSKANLCFSFEWQVRECLNGKAGLNCTWEAHMLKRVPKRSPLVPSESYYLPIDEMGSMDSTDFSLEHLLSNSSVDGVDWTYFFLDVPRGAAGANMHVQLMSDTKVNYEMYAKFGGIPSVDIWDYYANSTSSSNGSMFSAVNDSSGERIDFYILYVREGSWSFGLKHLPDSNYKHQTTMSISLEACPRRCSSHGNCRYAFDGSGLTIYSYCSCDRDHGGFDCSNELVSPKGHIWQSVSLIASNAAAILPAFWALQQKAFAEWVLFTSSGISSGLYHACDVGTWCALSFHVLQFMDFWLSFMAVVSTFVYMATIDETLKRAIHTGVSILTALLAVTGATRSTNIILVIAIGTLGLLIGWLLEFSTANRWIYCPPGFVYNVTERWQNVKTWLCNLMKKLHKRFRWHLIFMGFIALAAAAISWKLETNESYWIWHSLWHITIYTSSFLFLCSTSVKSNNEQPEPEYELTRQNSSSRIE